MKKIVLDIFSYFGYEIQRKGASNNPFKVQKELNSSEEPIIFDVGAHVGATSLFYRSLFPKANIYSFEPYSSSFKSLCEATSKDERIFPHNIALSHQDGRLSFNVNTDSESNSLLKTDRKANSYWTPGIFETKGTTEVMAKSIDSFCSEENISQIDILKIDVQGSEFDVLNGAKEMMSSGSVSIIYCELIIAPIYENQRKLSEYFALFESLGYQLFGMYYPARKEGKELVQSDFIFTRRF
jgi:FkbM family methyltransferase